MGGSCDPAILLWEDTMVERSYVVGTWQKERSFSPAVITKGGSRTVWLALIVAVLSVLQGFVFTLPFPAWAQALVGCVIAAAIVILRILTTQPITEK